MIYSFVMAVLKNQPANFCKLSSQLSEVHPSPSLDKCGNGAWGRVCTLCRQNQDVVWRKWKPLERDGGFWARWSSIPRKRDKCLPFSDCYDFSQNCERPFRNHTERNALQGSIDFRNNTYGCLNWFAFTCTNYEMNTRCLYLWLNVCFKMTSPWLQPGLTPQLQNDSQK